MTDNRTLTSHTRPPGFDPKACQLCGRPLRVHAVGEFCRTPSAAPTPTGSVPPAIRKETLNIMSKSEKPWVESAAADLKIGTGRRTCPTCHGDGTITQRLSKADIGRALFGRQLSDSTIVKRLTDPPLSRLQTISEQLGGAVARRDGQLVPEARRGD